MYDFVLYKRAVIAVQGALSLWRWETPNCTIVNKPSCFLHLLDWLIESQSFFFGLHPAGEGLSFVCPTEIFF
ncbi:hypothetical protein LEMLEM_LOCUS16570 [Lemmus lemmus]